MSREKNIYYEKFYLDLSFSAWGKLFSPDAPRQYLTLESKGIDCQDQKAA